MEFENSRLNPLAGAAQSEQLAAYAPNERKEQNVTLEDSPISVALLFFVNSPWSRHVTQHHRGNVHRSVSLQTSKGTAA